MIAFYYKVNKSIIIKWQCFTTRGVSLMVIVMIIKFCYKDSKLIIASPIIIIKIKFIFF